MAQAQWVLFIIARLEQPRQASRFLSRLDAPIDAPRENDVLSGAIVRPHTRQQLARAGLRETAKARESDEA